MKIWIWGLLLLWGCAPTTPLASTERVSQTDAFTAEGVVSVRGNDPFTWLMLETDQHNLYVVEMEDAERAALQSALPARYRITGTLYKGDLYGRPLAFLKVAQLEKL